MVFRVCAMLVSHVGQSDISASILTSRISRAFVNLSSKERNSVAGFILISSSARREVMLPRELIRIKVYIKYETMRHVATAQ
jgi:hypothetical protein